MKRRKLVTTPANASTQRGRNRHAHAALRAVLGSLLAVLFAFILLAPAQAATAVDATLRTGVTLEADAVATSSDDTWEYELSDGKATITSFKNKGSVKSVEVPPDIDGHEVTALAGGLFAGDTYLESVTFSCPSLTSMGEGTFEGCTSLKSVSLTAVEEMPELGGFKGCTSLASVTIPACVQKLTRSAFEGCTALATVGYQDPSSLAEIGAHAFEGCASLASFEMPAGMTSIGNSAFAGCTSLASVDFKGAGLEKIDVYAFSGCTALKTFHFPSGMQVVGERAFEGCTSLTTVSFGKQLPDTFGGALKPVFENCTSLAMMIFPYEANIFEHDRLGWRPSLAWLGIQYNDDGTAIIDSINASSAHTSITLPAKVGNSTVTAIQVGAAGGDEQLTEVIFPEDTQISYIMSQAFRGCRSLKSIVIPPSVTEIESGAFRGCSGLRSVEFNTTSLNMLQGATFYDCTSLREIRLPEGMTTLTGNDFYNCTSLESVYLPDTLTTIGPGTFGSFGHSQLMPIKTMRMPDSNVEMAIPSDNDFMGTWKHKGSVVFEVTYGSWADYVWFKQHKDNLVFEEKNRRYIPVDIARTDGSVDLKITNPDSTYTGGLKLPALTGQRWYETIYEHFPVADYTIWPAEGYDCVSVGQQKAVIQGKAPHFTGSKTVEFEITPKDVFFAEVSGLEPVTWDDNDWELGDWDPEPKFSVMFDDVNYDLVPEKDYTVSYSDNQLPGQATITLAGQGNFAGTKDFHFTIEKVSLAKDGDVEVSAIPDQRYSGAQITPSPSKVRAKDRKGEYTDDLELFEGQDYTLEYGANVSVGQGSVTLRGVGDYVKDSKTVTFNIVSADLKDATIAAVPDQEYAGAAITPALEISLDGGADKLVEGRDYNVTWSGNVNVGTARGTVTGVTPYCTGTRMVEFKITPKPVTIAVDDASKARGELDPAFTGTVEGLVRADDLGEVHYIRTSQDEAEGVYEGVLTAEYRANPNYAVSVAKGNFTITKPKYSVRFDSNVPRSASTTCSGSMGDQRFAYSEKKALSANGYSLPGYEFTGWNTKADGTGTAYVDRAEVESLSENGGVVTLYAQWSAKAYTIVFNPGEIGGGEHRQTAYFDQPDKLDAYSDAAFGWDSGGRTLHGWAGTGFGSLYGDGVDFVNLCGVPRADGSLADRELVAQWVEGGQIVVAVTKDGAPQEGLADELSLIDGSGTEFSVPVSYERGRYIFAPSQASSPGAGPAQLPPGEYDLLFEASGYPAATAHITYGEANATSVVFAYYTVSLSKDPDYVDFHEVSISGGERVAGEANTVVALDGSKLDIKTTVAEGFRFDGYTAVGVAPIWEDDDPSKAEQTIEVQGRAAIAAHVEPVEYAVTVVGGTADASTAIVGDTVTVTADEPEPGFAFVQWSGPEGVDFASADSSETTFTMPTKDVTITAIYAPIVIEAIGEKEYTGSPIAPTDEVRVSLEGVDLVLTADDYGVSFGNNVDAGNAIVTVTMKAPRAGSATSTFKITPKPATITVDSASKVEGEDDPTFTGSVEGLVDDGDLGEVKYVRTGGDEAPGTYEGVLTATYTENPNYDVTVNKGDFTIKKRLTVVWLDGDGSVLQSKDYGEGSEPPAYDGKAPTKAATAQYAYAFTGWDGGTVDGATTTYRPLFSETVNKYTVTFVDYDGTTVLKEAAEYDYGTPAADIERPADPAREADAQYTYKFTGWTPEVADVTADAVYTAVYESGKRSYEVTWLQDDGSLIDKTAVEYGEKPAHADPAKAATAKCTYTFSGWSPEVVPVTGDATYKATYAENPMPTPTEKGTLTFDLAGGTLDGKTGTITIEANVGDTTKLPGAPMREGYTFKFWRGSEYEAGADYEVKGDHTFTAEWEKDAPAPAARHTVTFDANGHGTAPASQEIEDGKTATKPADPKADGWAFGGWYTDKSCTKAYDFSEPVTADITLYAKWTKASSDTSPPRTGDDSGGLVAALSIAAVCALYLALFAGSRRKRDGQVNGDDRTRR